MTKLGSIEFDDRILDALRNDSLVIFAGAGVSVGPPSNLASFRELACDIAQGSGKSPSEPLDRFLGKLYDNKVNVHERAVQFLSPAGSAPNALHRDLLRLFRTVDRVRLVTTNFDTHFETAATELFGTVPDMYRAPALPLGYDFSGIVHVHGALPFAKHLVLTDADFGRAYLTEGWARRFLVDVFRKYTVLFVGYSHDDVVMNYLARALPPASVAGRFALTEEVGNWELLGIKPIRFVKGEGKDAFKELYDGVHRLADRMSRGVLDWQSSLAQLVGRIPPTDPEAISELEQAMREVYTTRFLLDIARGPEWIHWLKGRKYLDKLFADADLSERDQLLVDWMARHFVIQHPQVVVEMAAAHGLRMNPKLWWAIGRALGAATEKQVDEADLKRLVTVMLACAPANAHRFVLMWLAERCASHGCFELALKSFMALCQYRLNIQSGIASPDEKGNERRYFVAQCSLPVDHWSLNDVWTKHLKPNLTQIAQQLLTGITQRLEEMHSHLSAWDRNLSDWDSLSYRRSAIEPYDQDEHPEAIDVLVDAARDALESLATDSPALLGAWIERLVTSNVPLLRRLAIHAITVHPEKSPEERLLWLLNRVGLHGHLEHHEVYRAVALNYPDSPDSVRKAVVDAILAHEMPASDDRPAEMRTARSHFDWLSWLLKASPDCSLAVKPLATITTRYPEWQTSDHPEFTHRMGSSVWEGSVSPWTVEQLLGRELREQLDDLLNFRGVHFGGPSREGLLVNCREACKQNAKWAFELGWALAERTQWSTDLWPALIQGLQDSEMPRDSWRNLLKLVSNPALQAIHTHQIANLLYSLVKDGGKPFSIELLDQANTIAVAVWQISGTAEFGVYNGGWLSRAINHPAGVIVEFWLNSLSMIMQGKTSAEREMPESYRTWFTMVIQDTAARGGLGRTVLASQTAFLFSLDQNWTREHIIPLFNNGDQQRFEQAWDGFLMGGRLYPDLVDALLPAFVAAIPRLTGVNHERRRRFIEFFTAIAAFYVTDPTKELLPALFQQGLLEDRSAFASHLGSILRHMQQEAKLRIWNDWLKRFWKDRQLGVYAALDESEIRAMLGWLPHLGDSFPDAVAIALQSRMVSIEHSQVLYDLHESELVTQYAVETAELLIYLADSGIGDQLGYLQKIYARLTSLPDDVRLKVDEAFARAGVPKIEE